MSFTDLHAALAYIALNPTAEVFGCVKADGKLYEDQGIRMLVGKQVKKWQHVGDQDDDCSCINVYLG